MIFVQRVCYIDLARLARNHSDLTLRNLVSFWRKEVPGSEAWHCYNESYLASLLLASSLPVV